MMQRVLRGVITFIFAIGTDYSKSSQFLRQFAFLPVDLGL
jgi:hypothetical protein